MRRERRRRENFWKFAFPWGVGQRERERKLSLESGEREVGVAWMETERGGCYCAEGGSAGKLREVFLRRPETERESPTLSG